MKCIQTGIDLPLKIIFLFTGICNKMLSRMMKNLHVFVVSSHCHLGPQ